MKKKVLSILVVAPALSLCAQDEAFFQASLTPEIAVQSRETVIKGISLNIWGENQQGSFTLGFVNGSVNESSGFSWGVYNYTDSYTGVHWGIVNSSKGTFTGWQSAVVNVANDFTGLQGGMVNVTKTMNGLQWGMVNYTEELEGVQIGLANIVTSNPWFDEFPDKLAKGFVFVNWSF